MLLSHAHLWRQPRVLVLWRRPLLWSSLVKKIPSVQTKPQFTHDCTCCVYLGQSEGADLYFCGSPGRSNVFTTIIARFSSEGRDYASGWIFGKRSALREPCLTLDGTKTELWDIPLEDAYRRSVRAGLVLDDSRDMPTALPRPSNLKDI